MMKVYIELLCKYSRTYVRVYGPSYVMLHIYLNTEGVTEVFSLLLKSGKVNVMYNILPTASG